MTIDLGALAPYAAGIPVVADGTARETAFPVATRRQHQRCYRLDLGIMQRWVGSQWLDEDAHITVNAVPGDVTDATAAFNAAIAASAASGLPVRARAGTYTVLGIAMQSNVTLDLTGVTLLKSSGSAATHAIDLTGTTSGSAIALTANVAIGATSLTASAFSGLAVGDYVLLRDATYKYTSPANTGRNQELNRVLSVSGGTLTLSMRTIGAYTTANSAEVIKLLPVHDATIRGGTIAISASPAGNIGGGIYGTLCYGCRIEDVTVTGPSDDAGIGFEQSAFCTITGCMVRDGQRMTSGGYGYGFLLNESSHHMLITGNLTENVRENNLSNNTRHSAFVNNVMRSHADTGVNTHGAGCEHILIASNVISGTAGSGIAVGFGASPAPDTDIQVIGNVLTNIGGNGISITGVSTSSRGARVQVIGNNITNWSLVSAGTNDGILVKWTDDVQVEGNYLNGANTANGQAGLYFFDADYCEAKHNKIFGLSNGFGVQWTDCTTLTIEGNSIHDVSSSNMRWVTTASTGVVVRGNRADDTSFTFDGSERRENNLWGTKYERNKGAAASLADGGTITHGLVNTPSSVRVSGSVAGEIVTVTSVGGTTFTVAIKTGAGAAGTTQTVYWEAEL